MTLSTGEALLGGIAPATPGESTADSADSAARRAADSPTHSAADGPAGFSGFGLDPSILRAVEELGYREPTPIQVKAIPIVMDGRDVMGAAQTGTGKTAGFALPIIHKLLPLANPSTSPARHPVRALIIAPTRELADQIHENVKAYSKHTPLKSAVVFGGVDMKPQTLALRGGVEILTATPGRLLDHVEQKMVNLSQVSILVLDEADRMLDMGFLPDIQRIINLLAPRRQSLMFSATFSDEIRKLAKTFLIDPVSIEVARRNQLADNVEQTVYRVASDEAKRVAVAQLIRDRAIEQVIVFSNTKLGAGRLARQLQKEGLNAEAIHGDKSQAERLQTLDDFKNGTIKVLVATDVAARGLDIVELPAVINFDLPHSPEDYIHRIGRTGRAGASGLALSLMVEKDARALADIEKLTKRSLPPVDLAVAVPAGFGAGRGEGRTEGRSRDRDRDGRRDAERGREGRRDDRSLRRAAAPARPVVRSDPLFSMPYEPSAHDAPAPTGPQEGLHRSHLRRPPRKVAALLGGKR